MCSARLRAKVLNHVKREFSQAGSYNGLAGGTSNRRGTRCEVPLRNEFGGTAALGQRTLSTSSRAGGALVFAHYGRSRIRRGPCPGSVSSSLPLPWLVSRRIEIYDVAVFDRPQPLLQRDSNACVGAARGGRACTAGLRRFGAGAGQASRT